MTRSPAYCLVCLSFTACWLEIRAAHLQSDQQQLGQRLIRREGPKADSHTTALTWDSEDPRLEHVDDHDFWISNDLPTTAANNTNFTKWRKEYARDKERDKVLNDEWNILMKNTFVIVMIILACTLCLNVWGYIGYRIFQEQQDSRVGAYGSFKDDATFVPAVEEDKEEKEEYSARPMGQYNQLPCPDDVDELQEWIDGAGIDTSDWGKGSNSSAEDLFGQLLRLECALEFDGEEVESVEIQKVGGDTDSDSSDSDDPDSGLKKKKKKRKFNVRSLRRIVRVVTVKITATFDAEEKTLMCVAISDEKTGLVKNKIRTPTKKIAAHDLVEEATPALLLTELRLPIDWQKTHLSKTGEETQSYDGGAKYGVSFPGLTSFYQNTEVYMHVKNPDSEEVAGRIGLPNGIDFKVSDDAMLTSKIRSWSWRCNEEVPADMSKIDSNTSVLRVSEVSEEPSAPKKVLMAAVEEGNEGQEEAEELHGNDTPEDMSGKMSHDLSSSAGVAHTESAGSKKLSMSTVEEGEEGQVDERHGETF